MQCLKCISALTLKDASQKCERAMPADLHCTPYESTSHASAGMDTRQPCELSEHQISSTPMTMSCDIITTTSSSRALLDSPISLAPLAVW